mmetsp:Transcript_66338/g.192203  ORF Transcript_66338/g.192203 Transcript_66338/m.192203 type:complete len:233 (-) Transcript_66338:1679-2377(-)
MVPRASSWIHCCVELPLLQVYMATAPSASMPPGADRHMPVLKLFIVMSTTVVVVVVVVGGAVVVVVFVVVCISGASVGESKVVGLVQFLKGGSPQKEHSGLIPSARHPNAPKKHQGFHSKAMEGVLFHWHVPFSRPRGWSMAGVSGSSRTLRSVTMTLPWIMQWTISSSCNVSAWPLIPNGLMYERGSSLDMLQSEPLTTCRCKRSSSPKYSATSRSENSTTTSPTQSASTE